MARARGGLYTRVPDESVWFGGWVPRVLAAVGRPHPYH